jgi:hypothetical protein
LKSRGLLWQVTLVSFLYIYNKCASFFEKSLYFLTYPRTYTIQNSETGRLEN